VLHNKGIKAQNLRNAKSLRVRIFFRILIRCRRVHKRVQQSLETVCSIEATDISQDPN